MLKNYRRRSHIQDLQVEAEKLFKIQSITILKVHQLPIQKSESRLTTRLQHRNSTWTYGYLKGCFENLREGREHPAHTMIKHSSNLLNRSKPSCLFLQQKPPKLNRISTHSSIHDLFTACSDIQVEKNTWCAWIRWNTSGASLLPSPGDTPWFRTNIKIFFFFFFFFL